ncbi:hypothetical protein CALCODRAFT_507083 [Calocera cornea HHB12733]|uniref:Uncharacterized protein n=1 Tax=Calocera cornea HHB12733 TaxID=1353952 RepID=A0A165I3P6_9BASI|nr:hypothetical protein CALCODRAFT_507083 [Calocera cornea HHB12733]
MAEVQSPPAAHTTTPRFGRGRILRVLTLGKPEDAKIPRRTGISREGREKARDDRSSTEAGIASSQEGHALAPPKFAASDNGFLTASPVSSDAESLPPISPARPEDRSPDTEDTPLTPNDPLSPQSMSSKQAAQPPTLFKRFKTRLRSLSRGRDEQPKMSALKEAAPPVPNMPVPKDFAVVPARQASDVARPVAPVRRVSKGNLLAAFSNKSTPSLVKGATGASASEGEGPVPRRSSVPRLTIPPAVSHIAVQQANEIDPALVPLPESPLVPPAQVGEAEAAESSTPCVGQTDEDVLKAAEPQGRSRPPQDSPISRRSAQSARASKFFVGDSDDEEEDGTRRTSALSNSPTSNTESPKQRNAITDSSPRQGPGRRATKSGAAATADRRKTMFTAWRKSTDITTVLADPRAHKRGPSTESASSTDSAGASRSVNPVVYLDKGLQ